jgi:hypothetical protein
VINFRVEGTSTSQEKVIIENPDDADCYAWTIFGQREIENSKYPRYVRANLTCLFHSISN